VGKAVIVGGGPAGACLAYVLLSRGVDVTLIERQSDFAREFRGEVLMPGGVNALHEAGLEDVFATVPQRAPTALELYFRRKRATRIALAETIGATPIIVSQPPMLEAFVSACDAWPGFEFVRGSSVRDLIFDAGRAVGVTTADGSEVRGDLIVGADGRASIVRRRAGLQSEDTPEHFDIVWFKLPAPPFLAERGDPVIFCVGGGHLAIAYRTADGLLQMGSVIQKGSYGDLKKRGLDLWFEDLADDLPSEIGQWVRAHRDEIEHPFVLDVLCHLLPCWTAPGVVLLGDAAHPMSPVGAQGINIALRDVIGACNELVPVLSSSVDAAAVDAACRRFEADRSREAAAIQRLQRIPPRFILRDTWWSEGLLRIAALLARSHFLQSRVGVPPVARSFLFGDVEVKLRV
jgi:2-polyprenyl-6-methoxyphenol hydroxylase-like FAD-dependent oxidoreductase